MTRGPVRCSREEAGEEPRGGCAGSGRKTAPRGTRHSFLLRVFASHMPRGPWRGRGAKRWNHGSARAPACGAGIFAHARRAHSAWSSPRLAWSKGCRAVGLRRALGTLLVRTPSTVTLDTPGGRHYPFWCLVHGSSAIRTGKPAQRVTQFRNPRHHSHTESRFPTGSSVLHRTPPNDHSPKARRNPFRLPRPILGTPEQRAA